MNLDALKESASESFKKRNPHIFGPAPAIQNHGGEDDEELEYIAALTANQKPKKSKCQLITVEDSPGDLSTAHAECEIHGRECPRLNPLQKPKAKKRIRQSDKPLLNGLEKSFLEVLKQRYPYIDEAQITAQAIRFSLGNGIAYKADFVVFREAKRTLAYECKGPHAFRGGFENLKVAANKYPLVLFTLVWKDVQGQWQEQVVLP